MAQGDIYRIIDWQGLGGELIQNRYYYQQTLGAGDWNDMLQAFDEDVLPAICAAQVDTLAHNLIEVVNLNDVSDFGSAQSLTNQAGTIIDEAMPKWDAFGFVLNRTSRSMRSGAKRIGGVPEGSVNGSVIAGGAQAQVDAIAAALESSIDSLGGNEYDPILVREGVGGTVLASQPIGSVVFKRITTQNTRKR